MSEIYNDTLSYRVLPGLSPILLVADHAGRETLPRWGTLGLTSNDWSKHIAYDIGVSGLARILSGELDAPLVEQRFSRLIRDCNRHISRADRIPEVSDGTNIPGNMGLSHEEIASRDEIIFTPYQNRIALELNKLLNSGSIPLFVSLHSFTPMMKDGVKRPWEIGFLYEHDKETAVFAKEYMNEHYPKLTIGMNEPYKLTSDKEFTTPHHAGGKNVRALEIEIRQDLLDTPEKQEDWAAKLMTLLLAIRSNFKMDN